MSGYGSMLNHENLIKVIFFQDETHFHWKTTDGYLSKSLTNWNYGSKHSTQWTFCKTIG